MLTFRGRGRVFVAKPRMRGPARNRKGLSRMARSSISLEPECATVSIATHATRCAWLALCMASVLLCGCSMVMAGNRPLKRDLSVLDEGTLRSRVIAEFGAPVATSKPPGERSDVFEFVQGADTEHERRDRVNTYGMFDWISLGTCEAVFTPLELAHNGHALRVTVHYSADDCVSHAIIEDSQTVDATK